MGLTGRSMEKAGILISVIITAALLLCGCDFFIGPDKPAGKGSLTIITGDAARSLSSAEAIWADSGSVNANWIQ
jgi:hypothetical protein